MPTELENMESRRVEQGNVFSPKLEGPGVSPPLPACVSRLHHLESKVMEDVGKPSEVVCELKSEVESFKRKLEVHVSVWMSFTLTSSKPSKHIF